MSIIRIRFWWTIGFRTWGNVCRGSLVLYKPIDKICGTFGFFEICSNTEFKLICDIYGKDRVIGVANFHHFAFWINFSSYTTISGNGERSGRFSFKTMRDFYNFWADFKPCWKKRVPNAFFYIDNANNQKKNKNYRSAIQKGKRNIGSAFCENCKNIDGYKCNQN